MKITRIGRHARRERARVFVDGEEQPRFEIALDLLLRAGLAVGDVLDAARLRELEAEDEVLRAREAALRLLAHRPRSVQEIRRRLERQAVPGPLVDGTVAWLDERGYLDDRAFAELFVRDRLRFRPRGTRALVQELVSKGVAPATATVAVTAVLRDQEIREPELAVETARAWARRNTSLLQAAATSSDQARRARQRLYGHLVRRGFDAAAVREAVAVVLERED